MLNHWRQPPRDGRSDTPPTLALFCWTAGSAVAQTQTTFAQSYSPASRCEADLCSLAAPLTPFETVVQSLTGLRLYAATDWSPLWGCLG